MKRVLDVNLVHTLMHERYVPFYDLFFIRSLCFFLILIH